MTYSGLCINGPLDGQSIVSRTPKTRAEVWQPIKCIASTDDLLISRMEEVQHVTYQHVVVEGCGLWIPTDETAEQAVAHMANTVGIKHLASQYADVVEGRDAT